MWLLQEPGKTWRTRYKVRSLLRRFCIFKCVQVEHRHFQGGVSPTTSIFLSGEYSELSHILHGVSKRCPLQHSICHTQARTGWTERMQYALLDTCSIRQRQNVREHDRVVGTYGMSGNSFDIYMQVTKSARAKQKKGLQVLTSSIRRWVWIRSIVCTQIFGVRIRRTLRQCASFTHVNVWILRPTVTNTLAALELRVVFMHILIWNLLWRLDAPPHMQEHPCAPPQSGDAPMANTTTRKKKWRNVTQRGLPKGRSNECVISSRTYSNCLTSQ